MQRQAVWSGCSQGPAWKELRPQGSIHSIHSSLGICLLISLFTFQSQLLAFHPLYCTSVSISLISFFFITVEPHYLWITYLRMSTLEYLSVTLNSILVMLLTVILKHVHRAARN